MIFFHYIVLLFFFHAFDSKVLKKKEEDKGRNVSENTQNAHQRDTFFQFSPNLPFMRQITQINFLVIPDDFQKDINVNYLVDQLHRPVYIEKFYKSAATIYEALPRFYEELQGDEILARNFLEIMIRLMKASLDEPLSVTNIVFAICKHLRPLFKTNAKPFEDMAEYLAQMEKSPNRRDIFVMTNFFRCFTIREMNKLQNFITVMSTANLVSSTRKRIVRKKGVSLKNKTLDLSETGLEDKANLIRLTLSNAFARMLILIEVFNSDDSVINRTVDIVNNLWSRHLNRMCNQKGCPLEELDPLWREPAVYHKLPINFSFDDWAENITQEEMKSLKAATEQESLFLKELTEKKSQQLSQLQQSQLYKKIAWIVLTVASIIVILLVAYVFFWKRKESLQEEIKEPE